MFTNKQRAGPGRLLSPPSVLLAALLLGVVCWRWISSFCIWHCLYFAFVLEKHSHWVKVGRFRIDGLFFPQERCQFLPLLLCAYMSFPLLQILSVTGAGRFMAWRSFLHTGFLAQRAGWASGTSGLIVFTYLDNFLPLIFQNCLWTLLPSGALCHWSPGQLLLSVFVWVFLFPTVSCGYISVFVRICVHT